MKKEYPILSEYESLSKKRMESHGYDKEVLVKKVLELAKQISNDKKLMSRLKRDVPEIDTAIRQQIKNSQDRGIKR